MFRRKLRVILTIFGITIGVLALVVMGSMAEKINMLVSGGTKYYSDKVTVQAAGTSMFSSGALVSASSKRSRRCPAWPRSRPRSTLLLDPKAAPASACPP